MASQPVPRTRRSGNTNSTVERNERRPVFHTTLLCGVTVIQLNEPMKGMLVDFWNGIPQNEIDVTKFPATPVLLDTLKKGESTKQEVDYTPDAQGQIDYEPEFSVGTFKGFTTISCNKQMAEELSDFIRGFELNRDEKPLIALMESLTNPERPQLERKNGSNFNGPQMMMVPVHQGYGPPVYQQNNGGNGGGDYNRRGRYNRDEEYERRNNFQ